MYYRDLGDIREIGLSCPMTEGEDFHISHLHAVEFGCGPDRHKYSGEGLVLHYQCECGECWKAVFKDHSGGTWVTIETDPTAVPPRTLKRASGD